MYVVFADTGSLITAGNSKLNIKMRCCIAIGRKSHGDIVSSLMSCKRHIVCHCMLFLHWALPQTNKWTCFN